MIRVLIGEISVQFIAQSSVDTLHKCTFDVGISRLETLYPQVLVTLEIGYSETLSPYLYAHTRAVYVWFCVFWVLKCRFECSRNLFPSLYVKARYSDTLKTRRLPALIPYLGEAVDP